MTLGDRQEAPQSPQTTQDVSSHVATAPTPRKAPPRDEDRVSDLQHLGAEVRQRRESFDVSLRSLAAVLGMSPGYVSDIENGRRAPSPETLFAIADELRVTDEATRLRWSAFCGRLPNTLIRALLAHPERWGDVLTMLTKENANG